MGIVALRRRRHLRAILHSEISDLLRDSRLGRGVAANDKARRTLARVHDGLWRAHARCAVDLAYRAHDVDPRSGLDGYCKIATRLDQRERFCLRRSHPCSRGPDVLRFPLDAAQYSRNALLPL